MHSILQNQLISLAIQTHTRNKIVWKIRGYYEEREEKLKSGRELSSLHLWWWYADCELKCVEEQERIID